MTRLAAIVGAVLAATVACGSEDAPSVRETTSATPAPSSPAPLTTAIERAEEPTPAREAVELGVPARFVVPGHEGKLYVEVLASEIVAATDADPASVRCVVRLCREDGTDAGVVSARAKPETAPTPAWTGSIADGRKTSVLFHRVRIEPDVLARFQGIGVGVTVTLADPRHVLFDVRSTVYVCIR